MRHFLFVASMLLLVGLMPHTRQALGDNIRSYNTEAIDALHENYSCDELVAGIYSTQEFHFPIILGWATDHLPILDRRLGEVWTAILKNPPDASAIDMAWNAFTIGGGMDGDFMDEYYELQFQNGQLISFENQYVAGQFAALDCDPCLLDDIIDMIRDRQDAYLDLIDDLDDLADELDMLAAFVDWDPLHYMYVLELDPHPSLVSFGIRQMAANLENLVDNLDDLVDELIEEYGDECGSVPPPTTTNPPTTTTPPIPLPLPMPGAN